MAKRKVIVIIEDDKSLKPMYEDKFSHEGFEVYSSMDAEEGATLIKEKKPDLVLLDIILPREDGIYLLKKLKKEKLLKSTAIVVFSNLDNPHIKSEALSLGASDYLIKTDFTPREIVSWVKKYFKKSETKKVNDKTN